MTVVYALNSKIYEQLFLSLNSLLTNNPDCKVYIFCEEDSIQNITDKRVTVLNINNYPDFTIHPAYDNYVLSKLTFVRLWMANILTESRIIYLDADTIIDGSIQPLWETDLGNKVIGGVFDAYPNFSGIKDLYINAGVLLIDLDKWRKYNFTEKVQTFLKENVLRLADQDAINILFRNAIKYLDMKWNYQINQPAQVTVRRPIIFHYAAHPKIHEAIHVKHYIDYHTDHI